jgi:hypothetical protein
MKKHIMTKAIKCIFHKRNETQEVCFQYSVVTSSINMAAMFIEVY